MEEAFDVNAETLNLAEHAIADFRPCIPMVDGLSRIYIADEDCDCEDEDAEDEPKFPVRHIDLLDKSRLSGEFLGLTTEGLHIFGRTENEMQQYGFSNDKRREIVHKQSQQIIALLQRLSSRTEERQEASVAPHMQTVLSMWWLTDIMFFRCFYSAATPTVPKPLEEFYLLYQLREWQNHHTANDYEITQTLHQLSTELASSNNVLLPATSGRFLFPILRLFVQQLVHANIDVAVKLLAVIRQHFSYSLRRNASDTADSEDVAEIQRFEQLLLDCPFKNWISWLSRCDADQRSRQFSDWQKQCQYNFHQSKLGSDLLHYCVGLMSGERTAFALDQLEKLLAEIAHSSAARDRFAVGAEAGAHDDFAAGFEYQLREPSFMWHQRFLCLLFYEDLLATPYSVSRSFVRFRNQNATPSWFVQHVLNDTALNQRHLTFAAGNSEQILMLIAAIFLRDPKTISERLSAALNDCCWTALHFAHLYRHLPASAQLDTAGVQRYFRNIVLRYAESLLAFGWMPYADNYASQQQQQQQNNSIGSSQAATTTPSVHSSIEGLDFVMVAFDYLMLCGPRGRACISAFVDHLSPTTHVNRTLPFLHNVRALVERHSLPLECSLLHLKLAEACCYAVKLADTTAAAATAADDSDMRLEAADEIQSATGVGAPASGTADPFTAAVEHTARAAIHYPKLCLRLLKQLSARPDITRKQLALILNHICMHMQSFARFDSDPDFPLVTRALSVMVGMELKYQLDSAIDADNEQQIEDNTTPKQRIGAEDASFLLATVARCVRKCRCLTQATKVINDFLAHFAECIGADNFTLHSYRLLETAIAMRSQRGIPLAAALQKLKLFARQKLKELLLTQPELLQPPINAIEPGRMPHDADSVASADRIRNRKRPRVTLQVVSAVLSDKIESSDIDDDVEADPMEISSADGEIRPPLSLLRPPLVVTARKRISGFIEGVTDRRRHRRRNAGIDTVDADEVNGDNSDDGELTVGLKNAHSFRRRSLLRPRNSSRHNSPGVLDDDVETDGGDSDTSTHSSSSSSYSVAPVDDVATVDIDADEDEEQQRPRKFARTELRSQSRTMRKSITYVEHVEEEFAPSTGTDNVDAANTGFSTTNERKKSPTIMRIHTREVVILQTPRFTQYADGAENDAANSDENVYSTSSSSEATRNLPATAVYTDQADEEARTPDASSAPVLL